MNIRTACCRSLVAAGTCCLLLVATPAWAVNIFLELGDIEGESKVKGYEDWIDAKSFREGAQNAGSASTGGKNGGNAQFSDIVVTKSIDKASTQIRLSVANGRPQPSAKIEVTVDCGQQKVPKFEIELFNVLVSSVETTVSESEVNILPDEAITLSFKRIIWTYNIIEPDCKISGSETATWNTETNSEN